MWHINPTPLGDVVEELLISYIPLLGAVGIKADWYVIHGDRRFFTITEDLHNAWQGAEYKEINKEKRHTVYQGNNETNTHELDQNYDVFTPNDL